MGAFGYILFYLGTGLIVPLFAKERKGKLYSSLLVISIIIFCAIKGLVYDTATDYMDYYDFYTSGLSSNSEHAESLYKILVTFLHSICSYPFLFFALCAFLNTYAMLEIGHYYENSQRQVLLLWPIFMLSLSVNLYRQYIALAFIVLLYLAFQKRSWIKAGICAIIAVGFHTSALIGVFFLGVAYILSRYKINKWFFIAGIISATLLSSYYIESILSFSTIISIYYQQQTGQLYDTMRLADSVYTANTLQYFNMIFGCILVWCVDKILGSEKKYRLLFYLFAIGQILSPIMREQIMIRILLYITTFTPVILGITLKKCKFNKLSGLLFGLSLSYYFCYFLYNELNMWKEFPLQFRL